METAGRFHLWWADANAADINNFIVYVQVSAAGAVGVPATIYTIAGTFLFNDFTTLPIISGNQIFFTFSATDQFDVMDGNTKIACLIGTGLAAPVWQFVWVDRLGTVIPREWGNPPN